MTRDEEYKRTQRYHDAGYEAFWNGRTEAEAPISSFQGSEMEDWLEGWRTANREFLKNFRNNFRNAQNDPA